MEMMQSLNACICRITNVNIDIIRSIIAIEIEMMKAIPILAIKSIIVVVARIVMRERS